VRDSATVCVCVFVHARKAANLLANNPPGSVNAYWSIRPCIDRNEPPTVTGSFSIYSRSLITGFTVLYKLTEKDNETKRKKIFKNWLIGLLCEDHVYEQLKKYAARDRKLIFKDMLLFSLLLSLFIVYFTLFLHLETLYIINENQLQ